ncbi:STAS domain-containing protein [Streptomyces xanthochromogenes]|uniref:STAS domain-containing protein n=1 Tax=Streptomyces xanthochromogenes TaxID=67384 RepID=UPI00342E1CF0
MPGSRAVVRLHGEIDASTVEVVTRGLRQELRPGVAVLELDLTDVQHLSADGTAAFFRAVKASRASGTRLVITHPAPSVQRALSQVGLDRLLKYPS